MENLRMRIYLSGWTQEVEYRKIAKEYCGDKLDLIDPMDISKSEVTEKIGENCDYVYIVQRDKRLILSSDILVAYIRKHSFGTIMEIIFAHDRGIPAYVICDNDQFLDDPWLLFHSTKQFRKIEDCFDFIMGYRNETTNILSN